MLHRILMCVLAIMILGCAAPRGNPSFQVTSEQAASAMKQMQANPKPLARPVVVIGGFMDPNFGPMALGGVVRGVSKDAKIIPVMIALNQSFASCRKKIIETVDEACPTDDPNWTAEVDVIGVSLGGLAARYSAAPSDKPELKRRLKIARLFSIGGPHRGATMASFLAITSYHRDMRVGSDFLNRLAATDSTIGYQIYAYAHLGDEMVGVENAAPVGWNVRWLESTWSTSPHLAAIFDDRIHADICRRLRYETPFSHSPPAPLPKEK